MSAWLRSACGCWLAAVATVAVTGCSAGIEPESTSNESAANESVASTEGALTSSSCVTSCMASCFCDPDVKPTICKRQCQADCQEACSVCTPSCAGKTCGAADGCGGVCSAGSCPAGQSCGGGGVANQCGCTASCAGKACGASDGCGGVCTNACPTPTPGLIDFDLTPAGQPLTDATVVNTTYQSWGVTLSSIYCTSTGCAPASAYARQSSGKNGTNNVSLFQTGLSIFDARYGAVEASFAQAKSSVSIEAQAVVFPEQLSTPVARPFIEAYDAAGNLLTRTYYPAYGSPGFGSWQTLTVNAAGIRRVRFSSQAPGGTTPVYGSFDNLRFN
ncbi:MAG TPA: hypothetical protein VER11_20915 [Polyangiaceae bacterium]|nr:hypothetical protein [Polyangiaceae bacterium]